MTKVSIKRIYEPYSPDDGYRILVDRLWPRGVSKERALLDEWAKDLAPSTELRQWFSHDPVKFAEFVKRYRKELAGNPHLQQYVAAWREHPAITLLYGARDETHNEAAVLKEFLTGSDGTGL